MSDPYSEAKIEVLRLECDAALAREAKLRAALMRVQEEIIARTPGLARLWLTVTEAALSNHSPKE